MNTMPRVTVGTCCKTSSATCGGGSWASKLRVHLVCVSKAANEGSFSGTIRGILSTKILRFFELHSCQHFISKHLSCRARGRGKRNFKCNSQLPEDSHAAARRQHTSRAVLPSTDIAVTGSTAPTAATTPFRMLLAIPCPSFSASSASRTFNSFTCECDGHRRRHTSSSAIKTSALNVRCWYNALPCHTSICVTTKQKK